MANALLYGFMQLKDLAATRAIEVDPDLLISSIEMTVDEHNREVNALLNLFSEERTVEQLQFNGAAITRNQPVDANGRVRPIKPVAPYTVGFPIWEAGNAWGANRVTNAKLTVQKLNDLVGQILYGDFAWLRDQLLGTLFDNVGYTFTDPVVGNVAVKGLANSDAVTYAISTSGADSLATDTHYLAQANAIDNSNNPFPTIYTELTEHPENSTEVIAFINSAQAPAVTALTNFVAVQDPNVTPALTAARLNGGLDSLLPARATLLGRTDKVWIVQWNAIPSTYVVAITAGGTPPLVRRVDPEPELQGFRPIARIEMFPFFQEEWHRRLGFGGWNRVGAVVLRTSNASYAVPTNYGVPMS
jgi:hypothetical protein